MATLLPPLSPSFSSIYFEWVASVSSLVLLSSPLTMANFSSNILHIQSIGDLVKDKSFNFITKNQRKFSVRRKYNNIDIKPCAIDVLLHANHYTKWTTHYYNLMGRMIHDAKFLYFVVTANAGDETINEWIAGKIFYTSSVTKFMSKVDDYNFSHELQFNMLEFLRNNNIHSKEEIL